MKVAGPAIRAPDHASGLDTVGGLAPGDSRTTGKGGAETGQPQPDAHDPAAAVPPTSSEPGCTHCRQRRRSRRAAGRSGPPAAAQRCVESQQACSIARQRKVQSRSGRRCYGMCRQCRHLIKADRRRRDGAAKGDGRPQPPVFARPHACLAERKDPSSEGRLSTQAADSPCQTCLCATLWRLCGLPCIRHCDHQYPQHPTLRLHYFRRPAREAQALERPVFLDIVISVGPRKPVRCNLHPAAQASSDRCWRTLEAHTGGRVG